MEKLSEKHIYGYIPHGLEIIRSDGKIISNIVGLRNDKIYYGLEDGITFTPVEGCRLILNPMSEYYDQLFAEKQMYTHKVENSIWNDDKGYFIVAGGVPYPPSLELTRNTNKPEYELAKELPAFIDHMFSELLDIYRLIPRGLAVDSNKMNYLRL